jgi:hypothetical protein
MVFLKTDKIKGVETSKLSNDTKKVYQIISLYAMPTPQCPMHGKV